MRNFLRRIPHAILAGGAITLALYICLLLLLQSHTLWESPTLIADRWPALFHPLRDLFPDEWIWAGSETELGVMNVLLYLGLVALLFATYLIITNRVVRHPLSGRLSAGASFRFLLIITALMLLVLLVVPGSFSTDLYSYVWYGKISALFADNPLLRTPSDYAWYDTQGWLQWVYWKDVPSAYGPAWISVASGIAQIARALDNDIVTHLLGHKLLASGAHLLNTWFVWRLAGYVVKHYWVYEGRRLDETRVNAGRLGVTLLYAWNPLLLVEFGVSAHNDVLMLSFVLVGLVLHTQGRARLAVIALALACMIKASAILFLPGYIWLLLWQGAGARHGRANADDTLAQTPLRERLLLVGQCVALIGLVWVVCYFPYWEGTRTLAAVSGGPTALYFIHSLGSLLRFRLPEGMSDLALQLGWQPAGSWSVDEIGRRLDWPARWGPLAITFTVVVFQTIFARTFVRMIVAWCIILLVYLTIGAVWYWPWYVSWLIVPAILLGPGRILTATHILAISSLSVYAIYPVVARPLHKLADWTGLWVAAPPLLYLAGAWLYGTFARQKPA